jgi:hypothetical protein
MLLQNGELQFLSSSAGLGSGALTGSAFVYGWLRRDCQPAVFAYHSGAKADASLFNRCQYPRA